MQSDYYLCHAKVLYDKSCGLCDDFCPVYAFIVSQKTKQKRNTRVWNNIMVKECALFL